MGGFGVTTGIQARWLDNETLQFDDVRLLVTSDPKNYGVPSTRERFLLIARATPAADGERACPISLSRPRTERHRTSLARASRTRRRCETAVTTRRT
jgi:site-specific DNA-cytosine methylase